MPDTDVTPHAVGQFIFECIELFVQEGLTGKDLQRATGRAVLIRFLLPVDKVESVDKRATYAREYNRKKREEARVSSKRSTKE